MLQTLRAMKEGDRIVIVSNTTSVLDIIEELCKTSKYPVLRLDGTTPGPKRTKLVDEFNNQFSNAFVFLLSSKAGGCGINLIGGNRLVLFDPDWNPSSDKQAAGRIWREGQKKKCYIYRLMSTGTIEEKIIQRQLFKQSLQDIVDDRDATNNIPQNELKNLFVREVETHSDTHDTLSCTRCKSVKTKDRSKSTKTLNIQQIEECQHFLTDYITYAEESLRRMETSANISRGEHTVSIADLEALVVGLSRHEFQTLPQFSKKLRNLIWSVQQEIEDVFSACNNTIMVEREQGIDNGRERCGVLNIYEEFLNRWDDCVKMLTVAGRSFNKSDVKGNANDDMPETAEFVPQEGCPEDEDFNKWSHHTSVDTCDDEALRRACQDNDVVSFVFGLEVNWTLLQSKQEEQREEEEKKKKKAKEDLDALNKRRQMEKENAVNLALSKQYRTEQRKLSNEAGVGDDGDGNVDGTDGVMEVASNHERYAKVDREVSKLSKEEKKEMKKKKKKRSRGLSDSLKALKDTSHNRDCIEIDVKLKHDNSSGDKKRVHEIHDNINDDDNDDDNSSDDFLSLPGTVKKKEDIDNTNGKIKRRVMDDDDDDDDDNDDDDDDDEMKEHFQTRSLPIPVAKPVTSVPSSAVKKLKKFSPGKEREMQVGKDFRELMDRMQLFDMPSAESSYELVDVFEALIMSVGNFNTFNWVEWDESSISELLDLANQLVKMLENFPGIRPEKKLLIRPAFQSGSFAVVRIAQYKNFTPSSNNINLNRNLSCIYKEIGRSDLPRTVSGPLKSCAYKHKDLALISSSVSKTNTRTTSVVTAIGDQNYSQGSTCSSTSWDCPHCTYHHEHDLPACEMCNVKRPRKKRSESSSLSQSSHDQNYKQNTSDFQQPNNKKQKKT